MLNSTKFTDLGLELLSFITILDRISTLLFHGRASGNTKLDSSDIQGIHSNIKSLASFS
jgi:hypothetical protein